MEEAGVTVYCDFHGHSRRQNAFIYGCENRRNSSRYLTEKVFPFLMDRMAKSLVREPCSVGTWFGHERG